MVEECGVVGWGVCEGEAGKGVGIIEIGGG